MIYSIALYYKYLDFSHIKFFLINIIMTHRINNYYFDVIVGRENVYKQSDRNFTLKNNRIDKYLNFIINIIISLQHVIPITLYKYLYELFIFISVHMLMIYYNNFTVTLSLKKKKIIIYKYNNIKIYNIILYS